MKKTLKVKLGIAAIAMGIGILMMSIGFAMGGIRKAAASDGRMIVKDTVTGVTSLNFDIGYGEINVIEGSEYKIEMNEEYADYFISEVSNGVWIVKQKENKSRFNLIGLELNIPFYHEGAYTGPQIIITIPAHAVFDMADITIGAGGLHADNISASSVTLEVGAGEMQITNLTAKENMKVDVGAGSVSIKEAVVKTADINCGVGRVYFAGEILDKCKADCGIGAIEMRLENKEEECDYSIDSGIGNVIINDRRYRDRQARQDASAYFELNCGLGEIRIYNE